MSCKKVSFATEEFANDYIKKLKKTSIREFKPIRAYLCETCLCWHLTKIESEEQRQVTHLKREIENLKKKNANLTDKLQLAEEKILYQKNEINRLKL